MSVFLKGLPSTASAVLEPGDAREGEIGLGERREKTALFLKKAEHARSMPSQIGKLEIEKERGGTLVPEEVHLERGVSRDSTGGGFTHKNRSGSTQEENGPNEGREKGGSEGSEPRKRK